MKLKNPRFIETLGTIGKKERTWFAAFVILAAVSATGADVVWSGAGSDNRWSTPANWSGGAAPVNGDSVTIGIGDVATTVSNDIPNLVLSKLTLNGKNDVNLTIAGEAFSFNGQTSYNSILWTNSCSIVINTGVSLANGKGMFFFGGQSTVVNGDISVASGSELKIKGRPWYAAHGPSYGQSELIGNNPVLHFHGDIGGEGCMLYFNTGANGSGTSPYFYGNVNCKELTVGTDTAPCVPHFMKPGNAIERIKFYSTKVYIDTDYAFTDDTLLDFSGTAWVWGTSGLIFKNGTKQIMNRFLGGNPATSTKYIYQHIYADDSSTYESPSANSCTIELKGTEDAVTYVCLCDTVNVTWNPEGDYTQDFRDRRHVTYGTIEVKKGTVRTSGTNTFVNLDKVIISTNAVLEVASTNTVAFPSLTFMKLCPGAKLRVTEPDAETFSAGFSTVYLSESSEIEVIAGNTVNIALLYLDDTKIPAGNYTAATADWVKGAGTVTVAGAISPSVTDKIFWISWLGDGNWSDVSKWSTASVPGASQTACLYDLGDKDYKVAFNAETDVLPDNLYVQGEDNTVTLTLSNEVSVTAGKNIVISQGGRLNLLSGATLVNTNSGIVKVNAGGELNMTGTAKILSTINSTKYPVNLVGGRVTYSDNASLISDTLNNRHFYFTDGETVFQDSSRFVFDGKNILHLMPVLGNTAKLVFKDYAGISGSASYTEDIYVGDNNTGKGHAIMEFISDFKHKNMYTIRIATPWGDGTLLIGAGNIYANGRGVSVACASGNRYSRSSYSGGTGHLVVTGGVLRIGGSRVSEGQLTGLRLGDGSTLSDSATSYKPWDGYYTQTGGVVSNNATTCVGGEMGRGTFVQSGGEFHCTGSTYPFFVGVCGGSGSVVFSGGSADIGCDVFIGGIFTNAIPHFPGTSYSLAEYGWDLDAHYATGTFTVSGGNVKIGGDLNLGYDGTGVVERVGSQGSFSVAGDLTMSNTVALATSSGLRFVFDSNGIDPVTIGGNVLLTQGSSIKVDISGYNGKRATHTLLSAGSITGEFSDIEIVDEDGPCGEARITVGTDKVVLKIENGTVAIFR